MTHVELRVDIDRPPDEVFAVLADPTQNPRWQQGMVSAEVTSSGPWGAGATYRQVANFLGRRIDSDFEIVAYEPGRLIKGRTVSGSFPITFTRTVTPREGGSRVEAIVEGDASGFFRLFTPLLNWMVRRSIKEDYRRLKRLLEDGPAGGGPS